MIQLRKDQECWQLNLSSNNNNSKDHNQEKLKSQTNLEVTVHSLNLSKWKK